MNAAATADRTLHQSDISLRIAQRAWVGVFVEPVIPIPPGTPPSKLNFKVVWENSGLTPALESHVTPAWSYQDRDYLIESDFLKNRMDILNPEKKNSRAFVTANGGKGSTPIFTVDVPHINKYLFVSGTFYYKDIFGNAHTTQFCERFDRGGEPQGAFLACNIHNKMN